MKTLMTVIGTRPEIIKMSPLIPMFDEKFKHIFVHSGQHYSPNMDEVFFRELKLRQPDAILDCGGLPPAEQVGKMMQKLEVLIIQHRPDALVVHGDTNTTLAAALTAAKYKESGVRIVHVEAGCRSHNPFQTEEINRLVVDRISDLMFVPTPNDAKNLVKEGIASNHFFVVGNTVVDSCRRTAGIVEDGPILAHYKLKPQKYCLLTMHRQETVDHKNRLFDVVAALESIAERLTVVFPMHPRTSKKMQEFGLTFQSQNIRIIDPVGYMEMIALVKNSKFCITDSGGLQEEVAVLRIPAIVIRNETEYMHYVQAGILKMTGTSTVAILEAAESLIKSPDEYNRIKNLEFELPVQCSIEIVNRITSFLQ